MSVLFKASVPNTWLMGQIAMRASAIRRRERIAALEDSIAEIIGPIGVCECGQKKPLDDEACSRCAGMESVAHRTSNSIEVAILSALSEDEEVPTRFILDRVGYSRPKVSHCINKLYTAGKLTRRRASDHRWLYSLAKPADEP